MRIATVVGTRPEIIRLSRVIDVYESTANFARSDAPSSPPPVPEPTLFDELP